jgi:hypothetical protein
MLCSKSNNFKSAPTNLMNLMLLESLGNSPSNHTGFKPIAAVDFE